MKKNRRVFVKTMLIAGSLPLISGLRFPLPESDDLDLAAMMQPVRRTSILADSEWNIWGGGVVKSPDGKYCMAVARWPKAKGFKAWVTHSEVALATADNLLGPYTLVKTILGPRKDMWDADNIHNPYFLEFDGKYYIYYTGNYGNGEWWVHRNNQRVGVAVADSPYGPYERFDKPIIDVSPGSWDHLIANCPVVTRDNKGKYYMIYKGVSEGKMPFGGKVKMGVATADNPLGPWTKQNVNPFDHPDSQFPTDDNMIWFQNNKFYAIVKDKYGLFSKTGNSTLVLFDSKDALEWNLAKHFIVSPFQIKWADGTTQKVHRFDQPQLFFENGRPKALFLAVKENGDEIDELGYNIHIELK